MVDFYIAKFLGKEKTTNYQYILFLLDQGKLTWDWMSSFFSGEPVSYYYYYSLFCYYLKSAFFASLVNHATSKAIIDTTYVYFPNCW